MESLIVLGVIELNDLRHIFANLLTERYEHLKNYYRNKRLTLEEYAERIK